MKFKCEQYPQLRVKLPGGGYVQFAGGEADVTDPKAVEALKKVPAPYGVKAVGGRAPKAEK